MAAAWLLYIPPQYVDLEITESAYTYVLFDTPTQEVLDMVTGNGGTVTAIQVPDGATNIYADINLNAVDIEDDEIGKYFVHPDDDYQQDVYLVIYEDDAGSVFEYIVYQPNQIIVGNPLPSLPMYAVSSGYGTIYQLDYDDGTVNWSATDSDFSNIEECPSNFLTSDDGYLYFVVRKEEGPPWKQRARVYVIDPDGNDTEILEHDDYADGSCGIAYDRVLDVLYAEIFGPTSSSESTLYSASKTGSLIGSVTRDLSGLGWSVMLGMAAYNGNMIYVIQDDGSDYILTYAGNTLVTLSSGEEWTGDVIASGDGYVYALYKHATNGLSLIKVDPSSGTEWTYDFGAGTTVARDDLKCLAVNDSGVSLVAVDDGNSYKVDTDGDLVWSKSGLLCNLDNLEAYFY